MLVRFLLILAGLCLSSGPLFAQQTKTQKPPLHAQHWLAITGKPLAATAGAIIFAKGGNAVDAACAMLAAVTTMWDVLSLGRRDPGADLSTRAQEGHRDRRAGRGTDRSDRRSCIPLQASLSAGVRPAGGGDSGHAWGLMTMLAEYGTCRWARCWRRRSDGRRLSHRGGDRELHRGDQGPASSSGSIRTAVFLPHRG